MPKESLFERRVRRVRFQLKKRANGKLRLSVFRSDRHIYAQLIDDTKGATLVSASSLEPSFRLQCKNGGTCQAAGLVGKLLAERAVALDVSRVYFDRGGMPFHGRVKALADAAREAGLLF
jgi:large subunit ribosomal protein L18